MWIFPKNPLTLSLCGFGNFILTVGLAKDKKEQKRGTRGRRRAHRFCKVLLDVFIHFYVGIISSIVSVWGWTTMMCSWLMGSHLNFWSLCVQGRPYIWLTEIFSTFNRQPHLFIRSKCMYAHSHHSLSLSQYWSFSVVFFWSFWQMGVPEPPHIRFNVNIYYISQRNITPSKTFIHKVF